MKRIALFFLLIGCSFLVPTGAKWMTHGFRMGKMALDLYSNPAWEVKGQDDQFASKLLNEKLIFLNHGAQSFVFACEKSPYIVKLFRYDQRVHPWRAWLRDEVLGKKKRLRHDEKIDRLFCACKLATEKGSDLTGLVYAHLNQTRGTLPKAHLVDRLGRAYHLDMNRYRFVIQHRARPIRVVFDEAIQAKDSREVETLIDSFASLLKERTARGIRNSDTKVAPNFGFWGKQAIEWDFGNYWVDPKMSSLEVQKAERLIFGTQFRRYLEKTAPEYLPYYDLQVMQ